MVGSSGSYDPAEASHRALRRIQQELERHPIVTKTRGFPAEEFAKVVAHLETNRWGVDRDNTKLTVRWFAGETQNARSEFTFHYTDEKSDFGWHYHDQAHVDGWGHFQEQTGGAGYSYESVTYPSQNPARLVWEVMSRLSSKLTGG